jgi:plasmid stabilization system protein ParE
MALRIFWTNRASKNFDIIIEYLEVEWGDQVTKRFIKAVNDFLELLVEFPELGSIENKEKGIRGFTLIKQINIFYRITSDKIIILGLFDNRQNPSKKHRQNT